MIAIQYQTTAGTGVNPIGQLFTLPVSTLTTILRSEGRDNFHQLTTSILCFVRQCAEKLRPCGILDTFCETVIVNHPVHQQIFNRYDLKFVYDFGCVDE